MPELPPPAQGWGRGEIQPQMAAAGGEHLDGAEEVEIWQSATITVQPQALPRQSACTEDISQARKG